MIEEFGSVDGLSEELKTYQCSQYQFEQFFSTRELVKIISRVRNDKVVLEEYVGNIITSDRIDSSTVNRLMVADININRYLSKIKLYHSNSLLQYCNISLTACSIA